MLFKFDDLAETIINFDHYDFTSSDINKNIEEDLEIFLYYLYEDKYDDDDDGYFTLNYGNEYDYNEIQLLIQLKTMKKDYERFYDAWDKFVQSKTDKTDKTDKSDFFGSER